MGHVKPRRRASVFVLVVVSLVILAALGLGLLTVSYGVRYQAIAAKNEAVAMLAAEAGYEHAVYRMSQQPDMLAALSGNSFKPNGKLTFDDSACEYGISFHQFIGSRPIYRVTSTGLCGTFSRTVDVYVVQAVGGWDMGMCRVPSSSTSTAPVHYADGEVIDIPVHINNLKDIPDERDIYISGSPSFLDTVEMGESRYVGDEDKYASVMSLFDEGIYFDQPDNKITDESSVADKVQRFQKCTKDQFKFKPKGKALLPGAQSAVQLEFFVDGGAGKVRITDNCTVRGFQQSRDDRTWDYRITPSGGGGGIYERYPIYSYHVIAADAEASGERWTVNIEDTYVSQSFGGVQSEPGGQIFVEGNVIIGGDLSIHSGDQVLKGKMTVVATGNIWIADSLRVDGERALDGMPSHSNSNVMGLISQGVIRIVDAGMSDYDYVDGKPIEPAGYKYVPVGVADSGAGVDSYKRHLPATTVVESALTVGGGGFGAENVRRGSYGGRKEIGGTQDKLLVRGTLSEALRGVVGLIGSDGYLKNYYMDTRLLEGILPSDFWLRGKYVPAPAGWHDYRL